MTRPWSRNLVGKLSHGVWPCYFAFISHCARKLFFCFGGGRREILTGWGRENIGIRDGIGAGNGVFSEVGAFVVTVGREEENNKK